MHDDGFRRIAILNRPLKFDLKKLCCFVLDSRHLFILVATAVDYSMLLLDIFGCWWSHWRWVVGLVASLRNKSIW